MASSLKIWVLEDLVPEKLGQGQKIFDCLEDALQKLTMPPDDMDRSGVFDSKRMAFIPHEFRRKRDLLDEKISTRNVYSIIAQH